MARCEADVGRAGPRRLGAEELGEERGEQGVTEAGQVNAGHGGVLSLTPLSPGDSEEGQGEQVVATVAMTGDVRGACEGGVLSVRVGWTARKARWALPLCEK